MKILKKITVIFLLLLVCILVFAFIISSRLARKGLPDYNKDIHIKGLTYPVEVYRDDYGRPAIYAQCDRDLYIATGYIMAQERIWQMDLLRRVTQGRLSEILGDDYIKTDLLLRSLRFGEKSEQILKNASKESIAAIEAFALGVNQYITDNDNNYPLEFSILGYRPEAWKAIHSLNLLSYMAWDLKSGWSEFILEQIFSKLDSSYYSLLLPNPDSLSSVVYNSTHQNLLSGNSLKQLALLDELNLDIFNGSNSWAISGKRSSTGKPLMATDMHLSLSIPGTWIQISQSVEEKMHVSGLALPGQPFIVVGHNDSIAWGMTNTYVDNLDFYEEKINPRDSNQYQYQGMWKEFQIHKETIISKGGDKHEMIYRTNHRGPVVSEHKNVTHRVLTIRWIGDESSDELRSIYLVNRADNWEDFKNAFKSFRALGQNVVYADCNGNIGIYCCAGVPIRKRDKFYTVLPGWTNEYDWQGLVPFHELPYEYNPIRGYVSSANNRTTGEEYPYHIGTWYDMPYRIDRIREILNTKKIFTTNDFRMMQNDFHSKMAEQFLSYALPRIKKGDNLKEEQQALLQMLSKWDYNMTADKAEPLFFDKWTEIFVELTIKDELGEELYDNFMEIRKMPRLALYNLLKDTTSVWFDNVNSNEHETCTDIVLESFIKTSEFLIGEYGSDFEKWEWGSIHRLTLKHPLAKLEVLNKVFKLNRGQYPVGGSYHTIAPYTYSNGNPNDIVHGASHRDIFNLACWDSSLSITPTGTSGICKSRYYCDQTKLYVEGQYLMNYFSSEQIKKQSKSRMKFIP